MTKLVILFFLILVSGWGHAQTESMTALNQNPEMPLENKDLVLLQKSTSSEIIIEKNPVISSAARRSSLINNGVQQGKTTSQIHKKKDTKVKTMTQARRPSTDGRPAHINITVIPVPVIAKPNRMTIPNRRLSLPVGKS